MRQVDRSSRRGEQEKPTPAHPCCRASGCSSYDRRHRGLSLTVADRGADAPRRYAVVKTSVVESWPRVTSNRLKLANVTVRLRLQKTRSARLPMLLVRGERAGVPVHPRSVPTLSGGWADPTAIHDPDSWASRCNWARHDTSPRGWLRGTGSTQPRGGL